MSARRYASLAYTTTSAEDILLSLFSRRYLLRNIAYHEHAMLFEFTYNNNYSWFSHHVSVTLIVCTYTLFIIILNPKPVPIPSKYIKQAQTRLKHRGHLKMDSNKFKPNYLYIRYFFEFISYRVVH